MYTFVAAEFRRPLEVIKIHPSGSKIRVHGEYFSIIENMSKLKKYIVLEKINKNFSYCPIYDPKPVC